MTRANRPGMADTEAALRRLQRLAERLAATEEKAAGIRDDLYREMRSARDAGVTLSAMSRALGISRQRVQQIFERLDRETGRS